MKYKTIFFDLDGTITDSAPGIMNSIKYALEKNHLPMLSEEQLRNFTGTALLCLLCRNPKRLGKQEYHTPHEATYSQTSFTLFFPCHSNVFFSMLFFHFAKNGIGLRNILT